jgi:hypothetical protein
MPPLLILGYLISCFLIALMGRNLRFRFWGYLFVSIMLTPIIGMLLLIAAIPVQPKR